MYKPEELVTVDKATEIVDVSRRTIYNWMRSGKIKFVKIASGRVRIVKSTLFLNPDFTPIENDTEKTDKVKEATS